MFCKNCGNKLDDNAKFCPSCGAQTTQNQQNYTAPRPFEQHSVDESQNYQYQKSTFKGKQFSTGTSGSVSFRNEGRRKKGLLGRLIKLGIVVAVVAVVYFWIFGGGPVSNVDTGTGIDATTNELLGTSNTFTSNTPAIYVMFDVDLETGAVLVSEWYWEGQDTYIGTTSLIIQEDTGSGYFSLNMPNVGYWPSGDYNIDFLVDGEVIHTQTFTVE